MNTTVNHLLDQLALAQLALIEGRISDAAYNVEIIRILNAIERARA